MCPEGGAARWPLKVTARSHREEGKTLRGTPAAFLTQKAAWIVDAATSRPPRLPAVSSRQRTSSLQPVLLLPGLAEPDSQGRILQGPSPRRAALGGALQRQCSQVTSGHLDEKNRVGTTLPPEGRVSISVPRCLNIKELWHY